MYVLDASGDLLEDPISMVKIDVVLSDDFIYEVGKSDNLPAITKNYNERLTVEIFLYDTVRGQRIAETLAEFHSGGCPEHTVHYDSDTLEVIYEWCSKYRRIYFGRFYQEAYRDFVLICNHHNVKSVINVDRTALEPMFNYVFCREHPGRYV